MINDKRFTFRSEAREEATEMFGALVANSILAISDMNRDFFVYSPIGMNDKGKIVLVGPFIRVFDDMIEEVA